MANNKKAQILAAVMCASSVLGGYTVVSAQQYKLTTDDSIVINDLNGEEQLGVNYVGDYLQIQGKDGTPIRIYNNGGVSVDNVFIGNGSFRILNDSGKQVFNIDENTGNLTTSGDIKSGNGSSLNNLGNKLTNVSYNGDNGGTTSIISQNNNLKATTSTVSNAITNKIEEYNDDKKLTQKSYTKVTSEGVTIEAQGNGNTPIETSKNKATSIVKYNEISDKVYDSEGKNVANSRVSINGIRNTTENLNIVNQVNTDNGVNKSSITSEEIKDEIYNGSHVVSYVKTQKNGTEFFVENKGTTNISGGTITASKSGEGTTTISGGTITATEDIYIGKDKTSLSEVAEAVTKFDNGTSTSIDLTDLTGIDRDNKITTIEGNKLSEFGIESVGDVTSNNGTYSLNTIGEKTQGILSYGDGRTSFKGDVLSYDSSKNGFYSLNTVGANTAGIQRIGVPSAGMTTVINDTLFVQGSLVADGGNFRVDAKSGKVSTRDDVVTLKADGTTTKYSLNTIGANTEGIRQSKYGDTVIENHAYFTEDGRFVMSNGNFEVTKDGTAIFRGEDGVTEIGSNKISVGDATLIDGFQVKADNATFGSANIGDVSIKNGKVDGVDISELNTSVTENGEGIDDLKQKTQAMSYDESTGTTKFTGDVTSTSEDGKTYSLNTIGANTQAMSYDESTGTTKFTGDVTSTSKDGKTYSLNTIGKTVGGLYGEAGDITKLEQKTAGITRTEINGDWVTSIEGAIKISESGYISLNADNFGFTYSRNDGTIGVGSLGKLANRVDDLEQKTQGISYDEETGTTTIDGNLVVKDETTGGEGGATGEGGNITSDSVTTGNITADKGTIGGVTMKDNTVTATTGNFDNIAVGGEGGTTIDKDGITVGTVGEGESHTSITNDDVIVTDSQGNKTSLTNVGERVTGLESSMNSMNNRINDVEDRIDKVGAMAAAIANLRTMGFDPEAPTEIAIGVGQYKSETGLALGVFHYPNQDFMLSASISTSGDEVMGGIGATWKLGRKSAAEKAKDEEAKRLEKAEDMKKLAQEEKVKAQAERHAKLLAEREAQETA